MKPAASVAALLLAALAANGELRAMDMMVAGMAVKVPVASLQQSRFGTTARQQYDFSCGSAALATLLSHHYNYPISEKIIFEQMYRVGNQKVIRKQGFSLLDMQRFLAARGFKADGFEQPVEKLMEAGLPAVVLISEKGYNHFVVIKGMVDGRILLGDPSNGTRSIGLSRFHEIWQNKLLFVIHDFNGVAAFNAVADWRVAPTARLAEGISRSGLEAVTLMKHGAGEF